MFQLKIHLIESVRLLFHLVGTTVPAIIPSLAPTSIYSWAGTVNADSDNAGNFRPLTMTRLINLNTSNPQSLIVNNVFENKLRNGVISRGNGIGVVGNKFNNLPGSAIDGSAGYDSEEGGWSYRSDYSNNIMSNIKLWGVAVGLYLPANYNRVYATNTPLVRGVLPPALTYVTNNSMSNVKTGVFHRNTDNIYVANNSYVNPPVNGSALLGEEVNRNNSNSNVSNNIVTSYTNASGITVPVSHLPIFRVTMNGTSKMYFVTSKNACTINQAQLTTLWQGKASNLITDVPPSIVSETLMIKPTAVHTDALPAGRMAVGGCLDGEVLYTDGNGGVYRKDRDTVLCKYANDTDFTVSTGLKSTQKSLLPVGMSITAPACKI